MLDDRCEPVYKRSTYDGDLSILTHSRVMLSGRARLAGEILERWAMVAAEPHGEDSAGRQKIASLDPMVMAKRACDIADAAYSEFEARGWYTPVPEAKNIFPSEAEAKADA